MDNLKVLGKEKIGSIEFTGIEGGFGKDKKCMLAKDIADIHGQSLSEINRRINNNRNHFKDGIDVINLLNGSETSKEESVMFLKHIGFTQNALNRLKYIYLLSERGYLKLVKLLEDEKAWEIYEELVDNYFNMRSAVKDDDKAILRHKRLEIMEENSKTRQAQLMYKVAMETKSETMKQKLLNKIAERMTGEEFHNHVPSKQDYSATWIANQLGITPKQVGTIANQLELKPIEDEENEYGHWVLSKSRYCDKEVSQFMYYNAGVNAIVDYVNSIE